MTRPTDGIQYCQCGHELDDHGEDGRCEIHGVSPSVYCDCPEFRLYTEGNAKVDRESALLDKHGL